MLRVTHVTSVGGVMIDRILLGLFLTVIFGCACVSAATIYLIVR